MSTVWNIDPSKKEGTSPSHLPTDSKVVQVTMPNKTSLNSYKRFKLTVGSKIITIPNSNIIKTVKSPLSFYSVFKIYTFETNGIMHVYVDYPLLTSWYGYPNTLVRETKKETKTMV